MLRLNLINFTIQTYNFFACAGYLNLNSLNSNKIEREEFLC